MEKVHHRNQAIYKTCSDIIEKLYKFIFSAVETWLLPSKLVSHQGNSKDIEALRLSALKLNGSRDLRTIIKLQLRQKIVRNTMVYECMIIFVLSGSLLSSPWYPRTNYVHVTTRLHENNLMTYYENLNSVKNIERRFVWI